MAENRFEVNGIEEFMDRIQQTQSNFPNELQQLIEQYGGKILRDVKKKTPVDSGQLRRSWTLQKKEFYVKIFNNTEYGLSI